LLWPQAKTAERFSYPGAHVCLPGPHRLNRARKLVGNARQTEAKNASMSRWAITRCIGRQDAISGTMNQGPGFRARYPCKSAGWKAKEAPNVQRATCNAQRTNYGFWQSEHWRRRFGSVHRSPSGPNPPAVTLQPEGPVGLSAATGGIPWAINHQLSTSNQPTPSPAAIESPEWAVALVLDRGSASPLIRRGPQPPGVFSPV